MPEFVCPSEHKDALEEVKNACGIAHQHLDNWIYHFLANKKFDIKETIAKLCRRDKMEREEFTSYTTTPSIRASLSSGIVQYIGNDLSGRPVLYLVPHRHLPKAEDREENKRSMDMWLSWALRTQRTNPQASVTWLINQRNSSLRKNVDLTFQKDMAVRISKYFPGGIARLLVCNMNNTLSFVLKPILRQLPATISNSITIFSEKDVQKGMLLEEIGSSVLPTDLGGSNECDNEANWVRFSNDVEVYFTRGMESLSKGVSLKTWEVMEEYHVHANGAQIVPLNKLSPNALGTPLAPLDSRHSTINKSYATEQSDSLDEENKDDTGGEDDLEEKLLWDTESTKGTAELPREENSPMADEESMASPVMEMMTVTAESLRSAACPAKTSLDSPPIPEPVEVVEAETANFKADASPDAAIVNLRKHCLTLLSILPFTVCGVRDGSSLSAKSIIPHRADIQRTLCVLLQLLPRNQQSIRFSFADWIEGNSGTESKEEIVCTNSISLVRAMKEAAVKYTKAPRHACETVQIVHWALRRLCTIWPRGVSRVTMLQQLERKSCRAWQHLVRCLDAYTGAKRAIALANHVRLQFQEHGRRGRTLMDTKSRWFCETLLAMQKHHESWRKSWLFHVLPPLASGDTPPSMEDLVRNAGLPIGVHSVAAIFIASTGSLSRMHAALDGIGEATRVPPNNMTEFLRSIPIHIPGETAECGITPDEFICTENDHACCALEMAKYPLKEFLFAGMASLIMRHELRGGEQSTVVHLLSSMTKKDKESNDAVSLATLVAQVCNETEEQLGANGRESQGTLAGTLGAYLVVYFILFLALLDFQSTLSVVPVDDTGASETHSLLFLLDEIRSIGEILV